MAGKEKVFPQLTKRHKQQRQNQRHAQTQAPTPRPEQ